MGSGAFLVARSREKAPDPNPYFADSTCIVRRDARPGAR